MYLFLYICRKIGRANFVTHNLEGEPKFETISFLLLYLESVGTSQPAYSYTFAVNFGYFSFICRMLGIFIIGTSFLF